MCEESKKIKLCTCGEIPKPDWKLTRSAKVFDIPSFVMGSYMTTNKEISEDNKRSQMLKSLNENTLLDIKDYQPQEGDILEVFDLVIFMFKDSNWKIKSTYHPFGNVITISNGENIGIGTICDNKQN